MELHEVKTEGNVAKRKRFEDIHTSIHNLLEKSVNGTYVNSRKEIERFLLENIELDSYQVNKILASYCYCDNNDKLRSDYNLPKIKYEPFNQLHGNNYNHANKFYLKYKDTPNIDIIVKKKFEMTFFGHTKSPDLESCEYIENFNDNQILKQLLVRNRVVILTGTGISNNLVGECQFSSIVKSWEDLLNYLHGEVRANLPESSIDKMDFMRFFEEIKNIKHFDIRGKYLKQIMSKIDENLYASILFKAFKDIKPKSDTNTEKTNLLDALTLLNVPIATTNFDTLLEQSLNRLHLNLLHDIIHKELQNIYHKHFIFHVHGVWHTPQGFVLSECEYFENNDKFIQAMDSLLNVDSNSSEKSLLLIGMREGLFDYHFRNYLRNNKSNHYILVRDDSIKVLELKEQIKQFGLKNVRVLTYGKEYTQLAEYLKSLSNATV